MRRRTAARDVLIGVVTAVLCATHATAEKPAPTEKKQIEVCFVLDTTGSMGGLIAGAKQKIWSIANSIAGARPTPNVRFGLVGYRDRGDRYVTKVYDLTDNIDEVYDRLQEFEADGGGDGPESVNQALHEAVTRMGWNADRSVLKIIFLVGDAPPHMDYQDDVKYPETCKLAAGNDLIINTIQCGNMGGTARIWKEIADKAEGSYTAIAQSGGMTVSKTPMDGKIASIHAELTSTRLGYGKGTRFRDAARRAKTMAAAPMAPAGAERALYFAKKERAAEEAIEGGGREALSVLGARAREGRADLVTAVEHGAVKLDDLDEDKLPPEIRKLDKDQRDAYIKQQIEKRKELRQQLAALEQKRAEYIKAEQKKAAASGKKDGFDIEVQKMIREQGKRKGIVYD